MSHVVDDPDVHSLDARLYDVEEKLERVERVLKSLNQAMDSLLRRCGGPAAAVAAGIRDATKPYEEALRPRRRRPRAVRRELRSGH